MFVKWVTVDFFYSNSITTIEYEKTDILEDIFGKIKWNTQMKYAKWRVSAVFKDPKDNDKHKK